MSDNKSKKRNLSPTTSLKIHKKVKTLGQRFASTSNFEISRSVIVITTATSTLPMANNITLKNIEEEEQKADYYTVEQIAKIMKFLRNIED